MGKKRDPEEQSPPSISPVNGLEPDEIFHSHKVLLSVSGTEWPCPPPNQTCCNPLIFPKRVCAWGGGLQQEEGTDGNDPTTSITRKFSPDPVQMMTQASFSYDLKM